MLFLMPALSAMVITDANTTRLSTRCNARVRKSGRLEKELTGEFIPNRIQDTLSSHTCLAWRLHRPRARASKGILHKSPYIITPQSHYGVHKKIKKYLSMRIYSRAQRMPSVFCAPSGFCVFMFDCG